MKYILSLLTSFKTINFQDSIYALNIGPSLEMYSRHSLAFFIMLVVSFVKQIIFTKADLATLFNIVS